MSQSQSQALQPEIEIVMTKREAEQLALIEERILTANFFKGPWVCEDHPHYSAIVNYKHHEPHENCTGDLVIAKINGKPAYRRAIARLIARAPSMANLLEKALPIIEAEAANRDEGGMLRDGEPVMGRYFVEMRELANKLRAEIDEARGNGAKR